MPQTTTSCPRCRQPVLAEVEQLFDSSADPAAKQRLLSGAVNMVRCQSCGYQGMLATPIVFHDAEKELLLTYFPPELGLPINEQERMIGPLINQVVNRLPPEKRKAYLLRPQTMLTYDSLVERILEADGITKEMLAAQEKRLSLLQRLLSCSPESLLEMIKQEESLIDTDFFNIMNRLIEASLAQGDQQSARLLAGLQQQLLTHTELGQTLQSQAQEAEAAIKSLKEASKNGLTREALLELMIEAPTETRLSTLVGMARSGMDYTFFQLLSERIENASAEENEKLLTLRQKLLEMTQAIDEAVNEQMQKARKFLVEILDTADIEKSLTENVERIDEFFLEVVRKEQQEARQSGDLEKISKIQKVADVLQKLTAPPQEIALIEDLLRAADETARQQILSQNPDKISPEFMDFFANLIAQSQSQNQSPETTAKLQEVYNAVLRFSMTANLKK